MTVMLMNMLPANDLRSSLWPTLYRLGFLATFLLVSWLPADWIDAMLRFVVGRGLAILDLLTRHGSGAKPLSLTLKEGRTE
jgi:hypothetical protein